MKILPRCPGVGKVINMLSTPVMSHPGDERACGRAESNDSTAGVGRGKSKSGTRGALGTAGRSVCVYAFVCVCVCAHACVHARLCMCVCACVCVRV